MSKFTNMKLRYKIGVGVATVAAIAGAGGAAFAYWTNTGSGNTTGATGSPTVGSIAVTDTASTLNAMGPGVADQNVSVTFANNDGFSERVASVTVTLTVTPTTGNSCAAGNYEINGTQYTAPVSFAIGQELTPKGTAGASYTANNLYKVGFNDQSGNNQDGCKGATLNIAYASI